MEGILKILNLTEILPVCLADRLHLTVAVTGDALRIWLGSGDRRTQIGTRMWKICRGEPRNLANWPAEFEKNFAAENCGHTDTEHWVYYTLVAG